MFTLLVVLIFCVKTSSSNYNDERIDLAEFGTDIYGIPLAVSIPQSRRMYGNPEERGPYLEGDLLIPFDSKNGIKSESLRWKNREIPFEIRNGFNQNDKAMIERAFNAYHKNTCLKFVPRRSSDKDYISIANGATGCWSSIGRIGGQQIVNLQSPDCLTLVGTAIHEFLHAAGFVHEQNREDRDGFVFIRTKNIEPGREKNFEKPKNGETSGFGISYDYGSVVHYSPMAFSKNGQPTIEAKMKTNQVMGQRDSLSKKDIEKISKMYKC